VAQETAAEAQRCLATAGLHEERQRQVGNDVIVVAV
jgi:hypothetical protein